LKARVAATLSACGAHHLDLIPFETGQHVECGAFVYGCMSFTDKLSNGVVVLAIQAFHPKDCITCPFYYRAILSYGCGGVLIGSLGVLAILSRVGVHGSKPSETSEVSSVVSRASDI
ncbi:unnamed protein product, partial [Cyprideis torosa]